MTALFYPIFAHYPPLAEGFALPDPDATPFEEPGRDMGFATVSVGASGLAQGPVMRRFRDGRVTINAAGQEITGQPVGGSAPRGWWAALTDRL